MTPTTIPGKMDISNKQPLKIITYTGLLFTMPYFVYLFLKSVTHVSIPSIPPTPTKPEQTLHQPQPMLQKQQLILHKITENRKYFVRYYY